MTEENRSELERLGFDPERVVDERDVSHVLRPESEEERQIIACAISTYRLPDTVEVGDLAPDVRLHSLEGEGSHMMGELTGERPIVLFFGSYT